MRIKLAYNTLLNSNSQRGGSNTNSTSGFSYSNTPSKGESRENQQEEFYGLGKSS